MPRDERTYITVHDGLPEHPKVAPLSRSAKWGLIELWTYCSRNKTDGIVPASVAKQQGKHVLAALEKAGMLESRGEAWYCHDYLEHQRSKLEIEELKNKRRNAGSIGGRTRANNQANAQANAQAKSKQNSSKTQADTDTDTDTDKRERLSARSRATRLPENWKPSEADIAWQRGENITDAAARRETEKFKDHFRAASGPTSVKRDWSAAWKNWIRRAVDDGRLQPPPSTGKDYTPWGG